MRVAIGCDQNAYALKEDLKAYLQEEGIEWEDYGVKASEDVLYPEIALRVAKSIAQGTHERGILLCGTGLGMAIAANKVPGVRAATCHDVYSAERARKSNNAQIITMGAQVIGSQLARLLLKAWLDSAFAGGRSKPKVDLINEIDSMYNRAE